MAVITTDEQFRLSAGVWIPLNSGVFQGKPFVDASGRKIYDERPNPVDVTPAIAVLEATLNTANTNNADDTILSSSSDVMRTAKRYIRDQLRNANPNLGTIFNNIKNSVDGNPALLVALNNNVDVMALAYGWNAVSVKAATALSTNVLKAQYVEAAKSLVSLFA